MITCSVCGSRNDEFAMVCSQCKGFLQNKIPNLDFFDTIWKVLESPTRAFRMVTLAEHKNYSILLFNFLGVAISFTAFWYFRLGNRFDSLLDLLSRAIIIGIALGYVLSPLFTLVLEGIARLLGGKKGVRNSMGGLAYSTAPILLSIITIMPIELLTFGMYLFTANPHPYAIKPEIYMVLVGTDIVLSVWAIALAVIATRISKQLSLFRSIGAVFSTVAISLSLVFVLARYWVSHL
jgi:hypothetical protein